METIFVSVFLIALRVHLKSLKKNNWNIVLCFVHWLKTILSSADFIAQISKVLYYPVLVDSRTRTSMICKCFFFMLFHMAKIAQWYTTNFCLPITFSEFKSLLHPPCKIPTHPFMLLFPTHPHPSCTDCQCRSHTLCIPAASTERS